MRIADVDRRWFVAAAGLLVVAAGGLAVVARAMDDDTPERATDAGNPVEQSTTTNGDGEASSTAPDESAVPLDQVSLSTTEIGSFDSPISLVNRTGDTALYVAERDGRVIKLQVGGSGAERTYTPTGELVADISDQVTTEGERGLLDIAFSPDGARLYLSYSQAPSGESKVVVFDFDGTRVDPGSRRELLTVSDFAPNHNGGDITFGPDGFLYIAMGDGGGGGDPERNGQDTNSLLGKILRIDPEGATGGEAYAIPSDNPFVGGGGRPEVWIYGVRNPWRYSFDPANGDLWIGDVGQNAWEEIDYLPAASGWGRGANLGWNEMEASHPYEGGSNPDGALLPIFEYPTGSGGCAITGGVVYRGSANPDLDGAYLFGDFCQSPLRAIRQSGGAVGDERIFDVDVAQLVSFGVDNDGEVYAVSLDGPVYRLDP